MVWKPWAKVVKENIDEVIIDAGTVKGQSQPILVHSKNKSKTDKTMIENNDLLDGGGGENY